MEKTKNEWNEIYHNFLKGLSNEDLKNELNALNNSYLLDSSEKREKKMLIYKLLGNDFSVLSKKNNIIDKIQLTVNNILKKSND